MTILDFPDGFFTTRLRAERLEMRHRDELRRMHRDVAVMRHLGGPRDDGQTETYLAKNLQHWAEHNFGLWIVYERDGVEPIGRAMLRTLDLEGRRDVEVGYAFYEPYWGRGLASEVTGACLTLAREQLQAATVVAITTQENHASQHVLRKNGLTHDRDFVRDGQPAVLFRVTWPVVPPA